MENTKSMNRIIQLESEYHGLDGQARTLRAPSGKKEANIQPSLQTSLELSGGVSSHLISF